MMVAIAEGQYSGKPRQLQQLLMDINAQLDEKDTETEIEQLFAAVEEGLVSDSEIVEGEESQIRKRQSGQRRRSCRNSNFVLPSVENNSNEYTRYEYYFASLGLPRSGKCYTVL